MRSFFFMLLFIAAVILLGIFTIKLKRKNRQMFSDAFEQLMQEAADNTDTEKNAVKATAAPAPVFVPEHMDISDAVIPQNMSFSEEFELLTHLAEKYPDEIRLQFYVPSDEDTIRGFESRVGTMTDELRALYRFTNGFSLDAGSLEIYPLETVERESHYEYEWGNEEDYLVIGDMIGDGELIILDRRTGHIITNDHGEIDDHETLSDLIDYIIDLFVDISDEKI